ncbi:GntP family permease [Jatrophihabitans sp.]|uniref:GntP family permease n=1 Tax=Jatrophihabitans sp. TaxID=1932789 RepID=UPI002BC9C62E|nr:SLC13 family permease [Jatrophihabitans sp.]
MTAAHLASAHLIAAGSSGGHDTRLILAALIGIAVIIALITFAKLNPFLSLTIGALLVGAIAGLGMDKTVASFGTGVGATVASVGTLIALGAIFGKLLADSGGADQLVDTIVGRSSERALPWAMALVGMIIGLPMFFEIGLVLLMPVILLVARRSGLPLMRVAIPALAGLSAMHGFVPPHPGPLAAVGALNADLGLTLGLGVLVAVPTVIVGGPLFSRFVARWVDVPVPELFLGAAVEDRARLAPAATGTATASGPGTGSGTPTGTATASGPATGPATRSDGAVGTGTGSGSVAVTADELTGEPGTGSRPAYRRPSFGVTLTTVLLPVVLMLAKAIADVVDENGNGAGKRALDFIGTPLIALLLAVLLALYTFGVGIGFDKERLSAIVDQALPPIAGILLIVAAGGGLKQVLVDSGISKIIASWVEGSTVSPLLLAWFVAVLIRLATGSATVATITTAGILQPVAETLSNTHLSLLVLAIGAGSLFFSHVNDAGFWLTKQYFGLSISQNIKSWSIMETILSVTGVLMVLALSVVI